MTFLIAWSTETLEHVDDASTVVGGGGCRRKIDQVPEKSLDMQASDWPGGIDLHVNKFSTSDLATLVCSSQLVVESSSIDEREIRADCLQT